MGILFRVDSRINQIIHYCRTLDQEVIIQRKLNQKKLVCMKIYFYFIFKIDFNHRIDCQLMIPLVILGQVIIILFFLIEKKGTYNIN